MKKRVIGLMLSAFFMSACTIVDTGNAVDNLGRKIPIESGCAHIGKESTRAMMYTAIDGKRYIQLNVYYLPARAKWFQCFMVGGCPVELYPRFYYSLPKGKSATYYAEIEGDALPYTVKGLYKGEQINLKGASARMIQIPQWERQRMVTSHLPEQRNTLNTAVQPLRWGAEVVDIPLSIIATPVNWLILPTGHSLWSL